MAQGNPRGNPQNLINNSTRTLEERTEISRKGGIASKNAKEAKKTFKVLMDAILELDANPKGKTFLKKVGIDDKSNKALISARMVVDAGEGDLKKAEFVRNTVGEKPSDKVISVDESYEDYIKGIEDTDEY